MKKIISLLLVLSILFCVTGCGSDDGTTNNPNEGNATVGNGTITEKTEDAISGDIKSTSHDTTDVTETEMKNILTESQTVWNDVTWYKGADERILLGEYGYFYNRIKDFWEKIQKEYHFHDIDVNELNQFYDYQFYSEKMSTEPVVIQFGYMNPYDGDLDTMKAEDSRVKRAFKEELQAMDESSAIAFLQNIRKLCDTNLMLVSYAEATSEKRLVEVYYLYRLDGDIIRYTPLELDANTFEIKDAAPLDEWKEMRVGFRDNNLVVYMDGCVTELPPSAFDGYRNADWQINMAGYADDRKYFNNIAYLSIYFYYSESMPKCLVNIRFADDSPGYDVVAELTGNNEMHVEWKDTSLWTKEFMEDYYGITTEDTGGEVTFKFVCGGHGGFTIVDGDELYYYYTSEDEYYGETISDSLKEGTDVSDISNEEMVTIEETQKELVAQLNNSFEISGVSVQINDKTGKVTMDNSILFGYNSADLSDEGMKYLDEFLKAYSEVVTDKSFEGKISNIKIEGHADISGSYDYNLKLSQKRADTVAEYCKQKYPELGTIIKSEGKSYDDPIYNDDGTINMEASRRVEFKAILNY